MGTKEFIGVIMIDHKDIKSGAPGEYLDFTHSKSSVPSSSMKTEELTAKKRKKLKEGIKRLREKNAQRQAAKLEKPRLVNPVSSPRYDDIFFKGLEWLESLAGTPISEGESEAAFSNSVWTSSTRRGDDVS